MLNRKRNLVILLGLLLATGLISGISWLILLRLGFNPESTSFSSFDSVLSPTVKRFSEVKNVPQGLFNYGGSTSLIPIETSVNPIIKIVFPQFVLRYTNPVYRNPGSGTGITMLIDNQLSFALSSRTLTAEEYQQAKNKGLNFQEIPVAIDGIAIAVHPNLNVTGLTISQLKDIYTGKITNWSQVGGPDLPIIPYSRLPQDSGTVEFFVENVVDNEAFSEKITWVDNTTMGLQKVSSNLGGIYYASAPEIVPQCRVKALPIGQKDGEWISPYQEPVVPLSQCPTQRNQINKKVFQTGEYILTRRLFVIVKTNNSIDEQAGSAYANLLLTKEGQDLINQAGFVSLR